MRALRNATLFVLAFVLGSSFAAANERDRTERYPATIRCESSAEDMFGRPRLVRFERRDDGSLRLVYRCVEDDGR